jgi:sugar/nucleoside kinase (ribokinase family)
MKTILVVGSLAYDSIETPRGKVDKTLGGSANYFSVAAALFAPVRVVGVVGEDYAESDLALLRDRKVDTAGMVKSKGKTFHWEGCYEGDMNEAKTLKTELNVFEHFNPELPENYRSSEFIFLANIHPQLQMRVLEQVKSPLFIGSDTMNLWINNCRGDLLKVLARVNTLLINEGEARLLTGASNAIAAAAMILQMGPKFVVIKRGEYGFLMFGPEGYFMLPAVPISDVVDPTGAGDTFAGGFFGYLAGRSNGGLTTQDLKWACIHGSVMASFTVQGFGLSALANVNKQDLETRLNLFEQATKHP